MVETERMTYIGIDTCGCIRMAVSDHPGVRDTAAQMIGDAVLLGMTIERVPSHTLRTREWRNPACEKHRPKEPVQRAVQAGLGV